MSAHSNLLPPDTSFNWAVYADATFAGLAPLIPVPGVDWVMEEYFRRKTTWAIARYRSFPLDSLVSIELNTRRGNWLSTCLLLPVMVLWWVLKKISRKLLYFLAIKEAVDSLNYYWHRAFLIDYMMAAGHLNTLGSARLAHRAMDQILSTSVNSPLYSLAGQIIGGTSHIWRSLRRVRQTGEEDEMVQEQKSLMRRTWTQYEDYFVGLAAQYMTVYAALKAIEAD